MQPLVQLQHVNVKLILQNPKGVDLELLIPVFHTWIQDQANGELLLDIADYRHVEAGPGVVLIGHEGNYSVDNTDHRLGVRYNRKAPLDGSNQDRLRQAARAALTACQRLEAELRLGGTLRFNGQEIEIIINDRLLAPNNEATREAVQPDFQLFSENLFRGGEFSLSHGSDPRELFGASLKAARPYSIEQLLEAIV